jgi:UDP-glucose 4-epimerase
MKKILVTGGCGFIGTNLVPALLGYGHEVRVFDDLSRISDRVRSGLPAPWGEDVQLIKGDIRDSPAVEAAMLNVDTVIHLAAFGSVAESVTDPEANFDVNAGGTLSVLRACVAQNVGQFVLASTGGALIGNAEPPVNELSLPWPISPYGASKLCCEAYLHAFAGSYGLRTVALRFANVYGPHSLHKKGAVTVFIRRALASEPLIIYGDGKATRDFLFVDDLCAGIIAAVDAGFSDEIVHLASGSETSINHLAERILEIAGQPRVPIEYKPPRPGEVERNFATAEKARAVLNFAPSHDLYSGLAHTIDWFLSSLAD